MTIGKPYPYVAAIIQARLGSQRFPNKMLADINGKPMLAHVIERVRRAQSVNAIVVATPDKELKEIAHQYGAWGYHEPNHPENVLARYIKAAYWCGAQIVVRINGDCPLILPSLIDICVSEYKNGRWDMVTNVLRRTMPKGLDLEVTHINVLKRIYHLSDSPYDREHVTVFAFNNPGLFKIKNIISEEDFSWLKVCVDYPDDIDKVRKIVSMSNKVDTYDFDQLVGVLKEMAYGKTLEVG